MCADENFALKILKTVNNIHVQNVIVVIFAAVHINVICVLMIRELFSMHSYTNKLFKSENVIV